jgi:hypothetical protein
VNKAYRHVTTGLMRSALLCALTLSAQAAQFTVDQLMELLANGMHGTATFTETKYISILDLPVESSGELKFVPPAHLEKRTLRPVVETLVLDGDLLVIERPGQRQVFQLSAYPEVSGMIESLRATLAGDRQALERVYRLSLAGTSNSWTLYLAPLDASLGSLTTHIRIEGVGNEVRTIEILQTDGDRSVMRVHRNTHP